MQSIDVQQLLQPSEYSVIAAKKTAYRPRSSYQNGPRNNTITKINSEIKNNPFIFIKIYSSKQFAMPKNQDMLKQNYFTKDKMDLSTRDDYKTPEKVSKRLVLKHYGGTSQERIRQRRANSQVNQNMTYSGFYPHKDNGAMPANQSNKILKKYLFLTFKERIGNSINKTQEINHRQDSSQPVLIF